MKETIFVVEYPLLLSNQDKDILNNKLFKPLQEMYNKIVRKYISRLYEMFKRKDYIQIKNELYGTERKKEINEKLKDDETSEQEREELLKELSDLKTKKKLSPERKEELEIKLKEIKKEYGLDGSYSIYGKVGGFTNNMMKSYQKNYPMIATPFVGNMCNDNIWRAVEGKLFNPKKKIHFKDNINTLNSIQGNKVSSGGKKIMVGVKFDRNTHEVSIGNGKHVIKGKALIRHKEGEMTYDEEAIKEGQNIKYGTIVRKKDKFVLQLTIKGFIPKKKREISSTGTSGLDIGPQTLAIVGDNNVEIVELAPGIDKRHERLIYLQRKLDNSRRTTNKEFYNEKGEIIKITDNIKQEYIDKRLIHLRKNGSAKRIWKKSENYLKYQKYIKKIRGKISDQRRLEHQKLSNFINSIAKDHKIEKMNWQALAKRSKNTTINQKTGKINSKKRFGKSIADKAPAMLMSFLKYKAEIMGGSYERINTIESAASQYDFTTDTKTKHELNERWITLGNGDVLQRDILAAYNLKYYNSQTKKYNRDKMFEDYPKFKSLHDAAILKAKKNFKNPSSMGIEKIN